MPKPDNKSTGIMSNRVSEFLVEANKINWGKHEKKPIF